MIEIGMISGKIEEFATFDNDKFKDIDDIIVENGIGIKFNFKDHIIAVTYTLLYKIEDNAIVKLKTRHEFDFGEDSWSKFYTEDRFIIEHSVLKYIGDLSIDSSRGMLITKLNDTKYKELIIPLIQIENIIDEGIDLDLKDINKEA
ncbi:hypothetical protein ACTS9E_04425 [Empedobacter brevis]